MGPGGGRCDVATTSIWRVNGWLGKVLIYVENPDKTENPAVFEKQGMDGQEAQGLSDVIEYAARQEKTGRIAPDEEGAPVMQRFVSGVNCSPSTARDEMMAVKKRFGKEDGTVAYHPGERLRRPPDRGHRRQAHPLDPQREEHRHGHLKNTDMAIAIDDEDSQRLLRLFNTPEGQAYLKNELGLDDELIEKLTWLGISGIANVLCCIKMAKYYELTENDVVATVLTDSAAMYQSRIAELNEMHGAYNAHEASLDHNLHMLGLKTDSMMEMTYVDRKRVHNLKYYTWVEQQARDVKDLNALWYDTKNTWDAVHAQAKDLDDLINEFNEATGLLKAL